MEQKLIKKEPLGKGFYVYVSGHHTFGTDAVLLNNFAHATAKDKMVDLGTGCGIIPLLSLRDKPLKSAIGVDISKEATDLAEKTKSELQLENFTVVNSDLKELKGKVDFGCHTLVTCNPPYKAPNAGLKNPDSVIEVARHEVARDAVRADHRGETGQHGGVFLHGAAFVHEVAEADHIVRTRVAEGLHGFADLFKGQRRTAGTAGGVFRAGMRVAEQTEFHVHFSFAEFDSAYSIKQNRPPFKRGTEFFGGNAYFQVLNTSAGFTALPFFKTSRWR